MKKALLLFFLLLCARFSFAAFPVDSVAIHNEAAAARQQVLLQSLKTMTVKEYGQMTGKKLTLREKFSFIMLKLHLRKAGEAGGSTGSAIGGFFLGFLLLPIGVLITYLLPKNDALRRWSWIGFGAGVVLLLIIGLAFANAFGSWH